MQKKKNKSFIITKILLPKGKMPEIGKLERLAGFFFIIEEAWKSESILIKKYKKSFIS